MNRKLGPFSVVRELGRGGMGVVYLAEDRKLHRMVALKVLSAELARGSDGAERLLHEARMVARLQHPNIATVYELLVKDDVTAVAMEYVEGETLADRLEKTDSLELEEALHVACQIGEALEAAHERGIVHCDIKPSNVALTQQDRVKVLDFGLARWSVASDSEKGRDTWKGATPGFVSPEQLRGEEVDARTDLFALGALLYRSIAGTLPFAGKTRADVLRSTLEDEPEPLSRHRKGIPLELERVVRRAVAKDPGVRYCAAREMVEDLRRVQMAVQGVKLPLPEGSTLATAPSPESAQRFWRAMVARQGTRRALGILGVLLMVSSAGVWRLGEQHLGFALLAGGALSGMAGVVLRLARRRLAPRVERAFGWSGVAFRGLQPFQEADQSCFFGRELEVATLIDRLRGGESRFFVLYGESGCGKTSLLQAGLFPRLRQLNYLPIYYRPNRPLNVLLAECARQSQVERSSGEEPWEYLGRIAEVLKTRLVLVCDQFEELFVQLECNEEREPLLRLLEELHRRETLPVQVLVSIRNDFLHLVHTNLGDRVPDPLRGSRLVPLNNFSREQTREVLEKSATRAGLHLEDELLKRISRDLAVGRVVQPSELQIVGEQIQRKRLFSPRDYHSAGGKEALVHNYLEEVIEASEAPDEARRLLRSLISEEDTRLTVTLNELAQRTRLPERSVRQLLELLVAARMVRQIHDEEPCRFELMHEYLIEKIHEAAGRILGDRDRANRLLRQYQTNRVLDPKTRIPLKDLWRIWRHSDRPWESREKGFVYSSLGRGLVRVAGLALLVMIFAGAVATPFTLREEWDEVRLHDGHTAAVRSVDLSPDGRLLVSGGEDGLVMVWNFERRIRLATFKDHEGLVSCVVFSPDGKTIASGSRDGAVMLWDAQSFEQVKVVSSGLPVGGVAWSADGELLATTRRGQTEVWNVGEAAVVQDLPWGVGGHATILFSPSGQRLLGPHGTASDLASGQTIDDLWSAVSFGLSPDGGTLLTVDDSGEVEFVDISDLWKYRKSEILSTQRAHRDNGRVAVFSRDGRWAATGAEDIALWKVETRSMIDRFEHSSIVWSLDFTPDGRSLISSHGDGSILVWNLDDRQRSANLGGHSAPVRSVAYSPDGNRLASSSEDRSVVVWDVAQGTKIEVFASHESRVMAVDWSSDGRLLASCDQDGNIYAWSIPTAGFLWQRQTVSIYPFCHATEFSRNGLWLATSHGVFDSSSGELQFDFLEAGFYASGIYDLSFSHDDHRLLIPDINGQVALYSTKSWSRTAQRTEPEHSFISGDLSPDGEHLVLGADEGWVWLWTVEPLEPFARLGRHEARVKEVRFSPDGRFVVSTGDDQKLLLWDVENRRLARSIGFHSAPVIAVDFSPDGRQLATGEHDQTVRLYTRKRTVWGWDLEELMSQPWESVLARGLGQ